MQIQNLFLKEFLKVLESSSAGNGLIPQKRSCDSEPPEDAEALLNKINEDLNKNKLFYTEQDFKVRWNLNFSVFTYNSDSFGSIKTAFVDKEGVKSVNNYTISSAKKFYRIGTVESPPWAYYMRDPKTKMIYRDENNKPIWTGYCIDFIDKLAEKLDVEYEIVVPRSGRFGKKNRNGNWDGLVGDLITGVN